MLLRRAEEGELSVQSDESPRTERVRNARLRVVVWTALTLLLTWLTVMLQDTVLVAGVSWPIVGGLGIALCVWRLAAALQRLGS